MKIITAHNNDRVVWLRCLLIELILSGTGMYALIISCSTITSLLLCSLHLYHYFREWFLGHSDWKMTIYVFIFCNTENDIFAKEHQLADVCNVEQWVSFRAENF